MANALTQGPKTLGLKSTLGQLLTETISNKAPKGVLRIQAGPDRYVAFVCIVSDEQGYMQAIQAYENGRDEFAVRVANAVLNACRQNGVPEKNSDFVLHMHS
jgi:hypothetical protein